MTTPNENDDDRAQFLTEMQLVYQAAANGAMILPTHMADAFFKSMTAWNLEHCVGSEQDEAGEWQECVWQRQIILELHERWAGEPYAEPEDDE
jgi:hypothetical protein